MGLDRLLRHVELGGQLTVRTALGQQGQHLSLADCQLVDARRWLGPGHLGHERAHDGGIELHPSLVDEADGGLELARRHVLQEVAGGAGPHGLDHLVVAGEAGEHDHPGPVAGGPDAADGVDAPAPGHDEVEEDDVRGEPQCLGHRLIAVGGLADDVQAGTGGEVGAQPLADDRVVVDDQEPDGRCPSHSLGPVSQRAPRPGRSCRLPARNRWCTYPPHPGPAPAWR